MTCDDIQARGIAEDFLHDRLSAADREAYEQHFFECDACFADLEALRAVRAALAAGAGSQAAAPARAAVAPRWIALAAMLVIGVGGAVFLRGGDTAPPGASPKPPETTARPGEPPSRDALVRLARFEPPPYAPARLRSPASSAAFEAAMRRYMSRDFDGAIPLLRSVARDSDHGESARFFLGICLLFTDQLDEGVAVLNALGADSRAALAEDARFYKARGELLRGNASAALGALEWTIELHGDREADARALRQAIEEAQRPPR